ncbi:XapX domain-containing protein [Halobacteriales archaeon QH_8_64_26]|jgi:XapX domain-containing protein|nr:MAG: XapX domain-containing protein [Halobacteriales archaeon QH_8_64_26]
MEYVVSALALCTGLLTGALFRFLGVPIPAPPNVPGVLGIVGIYLGFELIEYLGVGIDLLDLVGL